MSTSLFDTIKKLKSPDKIYTQGREFIVDRAFREIQLEKETITEKNSQLSDFRNLIALYDIQFNVISVLAQEKGEMEIFNGSGPLVNLTKNQTVDAMKDPNQENNLARARVEIASSVKFDAMISEFMTKESINIHDIASAYVRKMNDVK